MCHLFLPTTEPLWLQYAGQAITKMKKVIYIALLSVLITAFFSACERILDQSSVEVLTSKGVAAESK